MINLKNKTAIITGASKGIGKDIAIALAKCQCNLILISRNIDQLDIVKKHILNTEKVSIKTIALDISKMSEVENEFANINEPIDILINNAGITKDNLVLRMSEEDWIEVLNVNLNGTFNCTKNIIKKMIRQKFGKIINISSIIGIKGNAGQCNYAASKAGLIGMTKSLAKELGSRNITVNAIAPGYIETDMTKNLNENDKNTFLNKISLNKFGTGMDVANLVCFLSSDLSNYISGEVINIDGCLD